MMYIPAMAVITAIKTVIHKLEYNRKNGIYTGGYDLGQKVCPCPGDVARELASVPVTVTLLGSKTVKYHVPNAQIFDDDAKPTRSGGDVEILQQQTLYSGEYGDFIVRQEHGAAAAFVLVDGEEQYIGYASHLDEPEYAYKVLSVMAAITLARSQWEGDSAEPGAEDETPSPSLS